ncbi:unnamed protein product [Cochlearia groenlandica]
MDLTQLRKQESNNGEFIDQFVPSEWNFDYLYNLDNLLDQEDDYIGHTFSSSSSSSLMDLISQPPQSLMSSPPPPPLPPISFAFDYPFLDTFQDVIETSHSPTTLMFQASQGNNNNNNSTFQRESNSFMSIGDITNKKNTFLKVEGKPSKNLMAERRRRKRLNDRLSMLRSIVPKITKMDRTSILGDAIEYMKELLEKINKLQELGNNSHLNNNNNNLITNVSSLVRNSPTFEVEQSKANTDIDINCCMKPGLIMSTISTLENLGLEIQQCVISSFNDFSLQASCLKVAEQRDFVVTSEDIKQALLINAGYGGSCS